MKRRLFVLLILSGLLATGCSATPTITPTAENTFPLPATLPAPVEAEAVAQVPTEGAGTVHATESAAEVTPEGEAVAMLPTPTLAPGQACIDCHTNADLLIELAVEEDVPDVPSEGSG